MTTIILTPIEIEIAALVGIRRRIISKKRRYQDQAGYVPKCPWDADIEAAAAELAYCKCVGIYWPASVGSFKNPDVGNVQVRHTIRLNGSLIVRPGDRDDQTYVLVTGKIPTFNIVGSISGKDAKQAQFVRSSGGRPGAWFVPQSQLTWSR